MYGLKRVAGIVLGATLLASLLLAGSAFAKGEKSVKLHLTPIHHSGVSGEATLSDIGDGVKVDLSVQGLAKPGVEHINHIHGGGTCADVAAGSMAPITIPLKTIVAKDDGTGSATTTIKDVSLKQLLGKDQHRFVLVHAKVKKGQGVPPGISCADIPQTSALKNLPSSGGLPSAVLLAIASGMFILGIGTILLVRRVA